MEQQRGEPAVTPAPDRPAPPARIVVVGDFVCPWSYIAGPVVERLEAEFGILSVWRPHWLHPEVPPEGLPIADESRREQTAAWIRDVAPEVAQRMTFPDRVLFSFRAFEALELAQDRGLGNAFVRATFDALWIEGRDIGDIAVLESVGESIGVDAAELGGALRAHTYAARALGAIQAARRNAISATPTFFLGRTRVEGWHYYEVLESILEQQGVRHTSGRGAQ